MIVNKQQSVFSNNSLVKQQHVLYDDEVISFDGSFIVSDFNGVKELLEIETDFNSIYLKPNKSLLIKDLLEQDITSSLAKDVCQYDKILYKKRLHTYLKLNSNNNVHNFNDYLYIKNIDYSIADSQLIYEYNLPKSYLLKALSTGCPDKEFKNAKQYNIKLQEIINSLGLQSEQELRDIIINNNTTTVSKIKINYGLLDLFLYCVLGSYTLRSGTKISLKNIDEIPLDRIKSLLDSLNIMYDGSGSFLVIDSNLIYSLFENEFLSCSFILTLSKAFVSYLTNKLISLSCIKMNNIDSLLYLQEFLYRSNILYSINDQYLVKLNNYIEMQDHFLLEVVSVRPVLNCTEYKEIS